MMSTKPIFLFLLSLFLLFGEVSFGQSKLSDFSEEQIESYKNRVKDQVAFFEYLLNTLGNSQTSQRDKEVIIKESYQKIFLNAEVQIEDDLSENRKVITNKDIKAYLKDVDFFFKHAQFKYEILETEALQHSKGGLYFRVTINRTLKATDLEGKPVLNTIKRYIEINLNESTDALHIASIYTTKVNRDTALKEWWSQLSYGWKVIFKEAINVTADSISLSNLNDIAALDSLNLSNNRLIQDVGPLSMLSDLAFLNLENSTVKSINALSSLTDLRVLKLSGTSINNLQYIQYAENIEELSIDQTQITDLKPIQHFSKLRILSMQGSPVSTFALLSGLKQLQKLNLRDTRFTDADAKYIMGLPNLTTLNLSKTAITSLNQLVPAQLKELDITFCPINQIQAISQHANLEVIRISNTQIRTLKELLGLPQLKRVYADNLFLNAEELNAFKNERPKVLLIVDSEELTAWWASLDVLWKKPLMNYLEEKASANPSKEALSKLINLDSLTLSNAGIQQLFPIKKFNRLKYLDLSNNELINLAPLEEKTSLVILNLSNNKVVSVKPLNKLYKLQSLNLAGNQLKLDAVLFLSRLNLLSRLDLNNNGLQRSEITVLVQSFGPNCLISYSNSLVYDWWKSLSPSWQQIFHVQQSMTAAPDIWQLTKLLQKRNIAIAEERLPNLKPLKQFVVLEALYLERLVLDDFMAIAELKELKVLSINKMPLNDLNFLRTCVNLEELNLDFTATDELDGLVNLAKLKSLSLTGTPLKSLNGIENLKQLEYLNIASTNVRWINKLDDLPHLKKLICYNTNIWERSLENYRQQNPSCEIRWY